VVDTSSPAASSPTAPILLVDPGYRTSRYTTDKELSNELQDWLEREASKAPAVGKAQTEQGEYTLELYELYQAYTAVFERIVCDFVASQGGSLDDLYALAKDDKDVAYSDAWMFITLFTACLSFKFFAECIQQAQEGNLRFDTTYGLDPKFNLH